MTAEFIGTAFLVAAVIGSGIMGEKLSGGNVAIALLANTIGKSLSVHKSVDDKSPLHSLIQESASGKCMIGAEGATPLFSSP